MITIGTDAIKHPAQFYRLVYREFSSMGLQDKFNTSIFDFHNFYIGN